MAGRRRALEPGGSLCRKRGCHAATDTVRYRGGIMRSERLTRGTGPIFPVLGKKFRNHAIMPVIEWLADLLVRMLSWLAFTKQTPVTA